jgi:secondary thiamine-phosphate synthase enzyme
MLVVTRKVSVETNAQLEEQSIAVVNLTPKIQQQIEMAFISNGTMTVFVPGTTASVTTMEFEPGLIDDFRKMWARIIPKEAVYKHSFMWEENNGYSHLRASMLGQSLVVPVANKRLIMGQYQAVVLVEFDNRSRKREVILQFMGE